MTYGTRLFTATALLVAVAACGGTDSSPSTARGDGNMRPGENCLDCHNGFTAAGTLVAATGGGALSGATVTIVGALRDATATTNSVGNFWTQVDFGYPVSSVRVTHGSTTRTMTSPISQRQGCAATGLCHGGAVSVP